MVEIPWAFAGPLVKILDKMSILKCSKLLSKMPGIFSWRLELDPRGEKQAPMCCWGWEPPKAEIFAFFQLHSAQLWDRVLG